MKLTKKSLLKKSGTRLVKHKRHVNDLSNVASYNPKVENVRDGAIAKAKGRNR